jgi:hypothetical protein
VRADAGCSYFYAKTIQQGQKPLSMTATWEQDLETDQCEMPFWETIIGAEFPEERLEATMYQALLQLPASPPTARELPEGTQSDNEVLETRSYRESKYAYINCASQDRTGQAYERSPEKTVIMYEKPLCKFVMDGRYNMRMIREIFEEVIPH